MGRQAASERQLIINADDLGWTAGTNDAIFRLMTEGWITSASAMMPCLSATETLERMRSASLGRVGVHLTLTSGATRSERPVFRQHPLPGLTDEDGCFHRDAARAELDADPEEVRFELEAQIAGVIAAGIDPTHVDSHAGAVLGIAGGRDFLDIAFDLCEKYRLPFNLPRRVVEQPGFDAATKRRWQTGIDSARARGISLIDDLVSLPYCCGEATDYNQMKARLMAMLKGIRPGITQWTVHPSLPTDDVRQLTPCWRERAIEYDLLRDPDIRHLLDADGIRLVSWQDIRDEQRRGR